VFRRPLAAHVEDDFMAKPDHPLLSGTFGPVTEEVDLDDFEVIGEIPTDLNGVFVRNGPNARYLKEGRYHWFDGDGMLHATYFDRGRVLYRNRYVRTRCFEEESRANRSLWPGLLDPPRSDRPDMPEKDTSNTDVTFHAGKLITMWYRSGQPYHIDPHTLETLGPATFGGTLKTHVSAHSKVDEATDEFLFFDYGRKWPYMTYGVVGPDGRVRHSINVETPGPSLPHDMGFTRKYSILHDLSLSYDEAALAAGRHKLKYFPKRPARFAVVPRYGSEREIRWFEAEPCFLYHVINCWDDGDEVVMVGCRYRTPTDLAGRPDGARLAKMIAQLQTEACVYEWRFNVKTGQTRERLVDDTINSEFPTSNSALQGVETRYSYNILMRNRELGAQFAGIAKYDLQSGAFTAYSEGERYWCSEAPFAPADAARCEDDGYLLSYVTSLDEQTTELHVYDARARELGRGPVARVRLPRRVPHGFHSTWVSAKLLSKSGTAA
jgi:carotenoid cleavage dioxygenase-like enzyme